MMLSAGEGGGKGEKEQREKVEEARGKGIGCRVLWIISTRQATEHNGDLNKAQWTPISLLIGVMIQSSQQCIEAEGSFLALSQKASARPFLMATDNGKKISQKKCRLLWKAHTLPFELELIYLRCTWICHFQDKQKSLSSL
jgi:hypothetical protein